MPEQNRLLNACATPKKRSRKKKKKKKAEWILLGLSPFCFLFWSFLLLFLAEHMLQRGISACRICLYRVDLLPLMLAKMCQLCLLFFCPRDFCSISALLRGFCSLCAPLVLHSARGRGVWFGTAFTTSLFHVFGA